MSTWPSRIFVTGTDTDAGKSYATGWLARTMMEQGLNVITQKFVQTGNQENSEDIDVHRRIMGIPYTDADLRHDTAPVIYTFPASPDLAARLDGKVFDVNIVDRATANLSAEYSHILIEGAGGLMVPLRDEYLTIDYVSERNIPTILVTNGKLGSINHTLLALSAIRNAGIPLFAVVYNPYYDYDPTITADTTAYIRRYLQNHFPEALYLEMPKFQQ